MLLSTKLLIVVWLLRLHSILAAVVVDRQVDNVSSCNLPEPLLKEIDSYEIIARAIMNEALKGSFKGTTWTGLSYFTEKFGPRLSGSQPLERSIDYVLKESADYGLENVHGENVTVPFWVRGKESATLLSPRQMDIAILGLGTSIATPLPEGITAEAIVVNSFEELIDRKNEVPGKIVVYNQEFVSYGETVRYRTNGATEASKYGAVAALIRSVTPYSLYTPHTGHQSYGENVTKIPVASITVEDATLLRAMANRNELIIINLKMQAVNLPPTISRNVVADFRGSTNPEKIVVVSGHIDSWDVGLGAMDDGGGAFISWYAVKLLKYLNYRPRRTVRLIMWTAEEMGYVGALDFIKNHKSEQNNLQFVMESDSGTFTPLGIEYTGTDIVGCILERIMTLLSPMGNLTVRSPNQGPDISTWINEGVPGGSLWNQDDKYFYYHHTKADTMLVENSDSLDKGTALFAAVAYILADLSVDLPRHK